MSSSYMQFQSIINYRIPINSDGTAGAPEITSKFTRAIQEARSMNKKKTPDRNLVVEENDEIFM